MKPNLRDWAQAIIFGVTGSTALDERTVAWVEAELNDIADKYYQMGMEEGWQDTIEQDIEWQKMQGGV